MITYMIRITTEFFIFETLNNVLKKLPKNLHKYNKPNYSLTNTYIVLDSCIMEEANVNIFCLMRGVTTITTVLLSLYHVLDS